MRETMSVAGIVLSSLHGQEQPEAQGARIEALVAKDLPFGVEMTAPLNVSVDNLYAGHRSHSSHSSHSSHASHYSGSGGYRSAPVYPAPAPYVPPPPPRPSIAPSTYSSSHSTYSSGSTPQTLAPSSTEPVANGTVEPDALALMVMRVQVALYAAGFDPGAVDGVLSEPTRQALRKFQAARGLTIDGRMNTATLNALGVAIPVKK